MQKSTDKPQTLRYTVMHYTLMYPPSFTFPFVNWQPAALVFWVAQQFSHIQLLPIGIAAMHEPLSLLPSVKLPSPSPDLPVPCHILLYLWPWWLLCIYFLCLFFLLVHCTVDIYYFLPWLLTIFQCSFQKKKRKNIYIYIYIYIYVPVYIYEIFFSLSWINSFT